VQEEPVESVTRLEAEREQTADLRAWAAELVEAGAQAVILLPALPAEVAELAIDRLARPRWPAAGSMSWQQALIAAAADMRMRIAGAETPPDGSGGRGLLSRRIDRDREQEWFETQLELALEVTLFAPTAGGRKSGG
jgi:hypothetical protein